MYRGVLIAERDDGSFDTILPHRWLNRPSLRSAKWWVAVYQHVIGKPYEREVHSKVLLVPVMQSRQGHETRQLAS